MTTPSTKLFKVSMDYCRAFDIETIEEVTDNDQNLSLLDYAVKISKQVINDMLTGDDPATPEDIDPYFHMVHSIDEHHCHIQLFEESGMYICTEEYLKGAQDEDSYDGDTWQELTDKLEQDDQLPTEAYWTWDRVESVA